MKPLVPFLRTKIQGLTLTSVETKYKVAGAGALVLAPRIAWAAGLAEFECVEVCNLVRCEKLWLPVCFGPDAKVELWAPLPARMQAGDALRVCGYGWEEVDSAETRNATFVQVGRNNAPWEIRRITARRVRLDPANFPPLPAEVSANLCMVAVGTETSSSPPSPKRRSLCA